MDIASRLDSAMRDAGFASQSALARASGVPQPTINRILKSVGKNGPEAHTLAKLAAACNVSFQWLHEGTGAKVRDFSPRLGEEPEAAAPTRPAQELDTSGDYSLSLEKLLLINAINEREAAILRRYRMASDVGAELIEIAASTSPTKALEIAGGDQAQNRPFGTGDGHRR